MEFLARKEQRLKTHVLQAAESARAFASVLGCPEIAYTCGLLHDLGKYTREYQDYLVRSLCGKRATRGETIHALQGCLYAEEKIENVMLADIIANIIGSHHGGLLDMLDDGIRTAQTRTHTMTSHGTTIRSLYEESLGYQEVDKLLSAIDVEKMEVELKQMLAACGKKSFALHLWVKMLFSCVVDADRCDAAGLDVVKTVPSWERMQQKLNEHLATFSISRPIDCLRRKISEQCSEGAARERGVYTLSVPTGGGKTLSSLRFALEHARHHQMKRIVYVIPYLSIIDQTAEELRKVFGQDAENWVLEHHSNVEISREETGEDDAESQYRLLTSRWDAPIILTTMVQFLETIYSNRASDLRKFHNMAETVFIFDEIQSLPIRCVHLFNGAINFLHGIGKASILLCTATQPQLDKVDRPVKLSDYPSLVTLTDDEVNAFKRIKIIDKTEHAVSAEEIAKLGHEQIMAGKSVLIVMNTKKTADAVFDACAMMDCEKMFLTTSLCPAHRLNVLETIKKRLAEKKTILCVSTQLIEAGVDISFDAVIRAEAGLDSIIQAGGRCNRNGEHAERQSVFVVDVADENLSSLPEIASGKDVTRRVLSGCPAEVLLDAYTIALYNQYYFFNQRNKMDYPLEHASLYELLGRNVLAKQAYQDVNQTGYSGLASAFKTAAEAFSVIDGAHIGVVVQYGEANNLIKKFQQTFVPQERIKILRQLQKYTVTIYANQEATIRQMASKVDDTFYVIGPDYYDSTKGLKPSQGFLGL